MVDLTGFDAVRALVVGDVMLDRYWYGDVNRISPEAPVPVVRVGSSEERAGGAANVAANIAALGASCTLLSVLGDDDAGHSLENLLRDSGIDARLHRDPGTSTTVKLRVLSRNQQLMRLDFESRPGHEILAHCLDDFTACLDGIDVVVFSDYGKGGLVHLGSMMESAIAQGIPVIVDPKGRDFSRYRRASLVTPNRREFEDLVGECASEQELEERAHGLIGDLQLGGLLLTRSEQGMTLFRRDGSRADSPARGREVYDVTGAGDTVIAAIAVAQAAGLSDHDAMMVANAAAGIVVSRLGTASVTQAELAGALAES